MLRTVIITMLNIALPFLLRFLYIYALRLMAKRDAKKGIKDVTPPQWDFPIVKLVFIGLLLTILSIGFTRIFITQVDAPYVGNISKSEVK